MGLDQERLFTCCLDGVTSATSVEEEDPGSKRRVIVLLAALAAAGKWMLQMCWEGFGPFY